MPIKTFTNGVPDADDDPAVYWDPEFVDYDDRFEEVLLEHYRGTRLTNSYIPDVVHSEPLTQSLGLEPLGFTPIVHNINS